MPNNPLSVDVLNLSGQNVTATNNSLYVNDILVGYGVYYPTSNPNNFDFFNSNNEVFPAILQDDVPSSIIAHSPPKRRILID